MSSISSDLLTLEAARIPVDSIFLDPNNPRLVGIAGQATVPDEEITNEDLQTRLASELKEIGLSDISDKIKKLGYINIDRIVVRPIDGRDDIFVVLEGNRRLAAVKSIRANAALMATLSAEIRMSLNELETLIYRGSDRDLAWVIQGFRHIESIKEWGPFQQGRYLVDLQQRRNFSVTEVADVAGIGRSKVSRLIRSFYGWQQAREDPDFGELIDEKDFSIFQEAIFHQNNSPLWSWLQWNDKNHLFEETARLGALLRLLKDKSDGGPRIARVNPDLRDKFSRLLAPGNERALQAFFSGEKDLEKALLEVELEASAVQKQEELVDLEAQLKHLTETEERLQTIPLPKIIESGRSAEFRTAMAAIARTARKQEELLSNS